MERVYIFLADGFEDVEAIATRDVLCRGGVDVILVSVVEDPFVTSSHGLTISADCSFDDFLSYWQDGEVSSEDVLVFPGGMPGTKNLAASKRLMAVMEQHREEGGCLAAICAAPGLVLGQLEDLSGVEFTCFDSFENYAIEKGAKFVKKPAVRSGKIITGRSAGYAIDFGLEILSYIKGDTVADQVRHSVSLDCE